MDFFERQDSARRNTKWLVVCFLLSVVATIGLVYFLLLYLFGTKDFSAFGYIYAFEESTVGHYTRETPRSLWSPVLFAWVSCITGSIIFTGSATKFFQLSQGGRVVAESLSGRLLNENSASIKEKILLNVVGEMAIASGVPVPDVYILDDESSINAFAAGFAPGDAVIGVTKGCLGA